IDSQNSTRRAHSAKIALGLVTIAGDGIWNLELPFQWLESGSFFEAWRPRGKKSARGQVSVSGRSHRAVLSTELRSEEHTYELQSLMRISYAVFCLIQKQK